MLAQTRVERNAGEKCDSDHQRPEETRGARRQETEEGGRALSLRCARGGGASVRAGEAAAVALAVPCDTTRYATVAFEPRLPARAVGA
eukprot:865036-Rhodomonas_salina.1